MSIGHNNDFQLAISAVDAAMDIALRRVAPHARLTILHIRDEAPFIVSSNDSALTGHRRYVEKALTELSERVRAKSLHVIQLTFDPDPGFGEKIAAYAAGHEIDLIVMSSHGRRGAKRLFLGSVAERVAHLATAHVLILHTPPL